MSSSEDDAPLMRANGRGKVSPKSPDVVEMADSKPATNGHMEKTRWGASKRKSRASVGEKKSYAEAESSEEDEPLSKRRRTSVKHEDPETDDDVPLARNGRKLPKAAETSIGDESDSDVPIERKLAAQKKKIEQTAEKEAKLARKPVAPKKEAKPAAAKKQANGVKKEPATSKAAPKKVKAEPASAKKGKAKVKAESQDAEEKEEEDEEEYRWWEDHSKGDGTIKWTTLEHNGVVFPSRIRSAA
ncbi:hypothetical protein HAV15_007623 [Penicillium sp. str. |nr:hypothetical protein HAV15_007623 [Penicillium sp. str. \